MSFPPRAILCNDFTCFAGICGALPDGKDDPVLCFAVIVEQQLFMAKLLAYVKQDDVSPAAPARPHPYQIFSRNLGQNTMRW